MKENTTRILIYAVIFLAVLNIATFSTIGYHIYDSRNEKMNKTLTTERNTGVFSGRYFRDRLQLSPAQMDLFRVVNNEFRSHAKRINMELIFQRKQMLKEMQQQSSDTVDLNAFSHSIGMLHNDFKRYTYKYYMGIRGICFKQQQYELDNIFEEFFINDLHVEKRGVRENREQRRHGQQTNND